MWRKNNKKKELRMTPLFAWATGRVTHNWEWGNYRMTWFEGWQVEYQSWVLAMSGFICLPDIQVEMSHRSCMHRCGIQGKPWTSASQRHAIENFKTRLGHQQNEHPKRTCSMTKLWGTPTLTAWEDWDGNSKREAADRKAGGKLWSWSVLEPKRRNQGRGNVNCAACAIDWNC